MDIFCHCGHEQDLHQRPSQEDLFEVFRREGSFHEMLAAEMSILRPCRAGCPCPTFSPLPLPIGTYVQTNCGEDGFEIVGYEFNGPERRCVFEACPIPEGDERYKVAIFPQVGRNIDEQDHHDRMWEEGPGDEEFWDEVADDPDTTVDAPVRYVPSTACVHCVVAAAGNGPIEDPTDDND